LFTRGLVQQHEADLTPETAVRLKNYDVAANNRVVLSHDVHIMETQAAARLLAGKPMPSLFLIDQYLPIGRAIDEIVLIAACSRDDEWNGAIEHLPI